MKGEKVEKEGSKVKKENIKEAKDHPHTSDSDDGMSSASVLARPFLSAEHISVNNVISCTGVRKVSHVGHLCFLLRKLRLFNYATYTFCLRNLHQKKAIYGFKKVHDVCF